MIYGHLLPQMISSVELCASNGQTDLVTDIARGTIGKIVAAMVVWIILGLSMTVHCLYLTKKIRSLSNGDVRGPEANR